MRGKIQFEATRRTTGKSFSMAALALASSVMLAGCTTTDTRIAGAGAGALAGAMVAGPIGAAAGGVAGAVAGPTIARKNRARKNRSYDRRY